jgi:hypothetical protein
MKLAFITAGEHTFVTLESEAVNYALQLEHCGHEIERIEIVPIGSSIRKETKTEVYKDRIIDLDLTFLSK